MLTNYKEQLNRKFGLTADTNSVAFQKGYEDGKIASKNGTKIKEFPIDYLLTKTSSYSWGYYDGFVDN